MPLASRKVSGLKTPAFETGAGKMNSTAKNSVSEIRFIKECPFVICWERERQSQLKMATPWRNDKNGMSLNPRNPKDPCAGV
jgi:hypothetical protein